MKLKDLVKMVLGVAMVGNLCVGVACADGSTRSVFIALVMLGLSFIDYIILNMMGAFNELH